MIRLPERFTDSDGTEYIHALCPSCGMGICADLGAYLAHKKRCAAYHGVVGGQSTLSDFAEGA